jgi:REP element-mobilizing transposase RayT
MLRSHESLPKGQYAFFTTSSVVEWLPLFRLAPYRTIVLNSLTYIVEHKNVRLNAYVLMPSHLHAILWPPENLRIGDVMRDLKRFTSRAISCLAEERSDTAYWRAFRRARQSGRARDRSAYQVWQDGSHPEAIYSPAFARQKLEYIHNNPVKAGLASTAIEWPYSSARPICLAKRRLCQLTSCRSEPCTASAGERFGRQFSCTCGAAGPRSRAAGALYRHSEPDTHEVRIELVTHDETGGQGLIAGCQCWPADASSQPPTGHQ